MAEFRQVHCKTWRDDWFSELDTDEKLLWLYLITNQATSVSGIYQLPRKFIAFETGLNIERVTEILEKFKEQQKIDFDDSVIWVCKMREYQSTSSDKVATRIRIDIDSIPNCRVKGIYCRKYGIDTVSIPVLQSSSDTETETETEKRQKRSSADKPRSKPAKETCPAEWMTALYTLTQSDPALASVGLRKRISETGKALIKAGAKLEDVERFSAWWSSDKWRLEHTPTPTPEQVRDNWQKMNGFKPNGNGHNTSIDDEHAAALKRAYR